MTKRVVDIDDAVLAQAARVLGTATTQETVSRALAEVVLLTERRAHAARLADMEGMDLADDRVMRRAWR